MNKKEFSLIIIMWVFLSVLTACLGMMPSTTEMFLKAFGVCFIFWGCLFFLPVLANFTD